jgi:hypothetical protein
MSVWADAIPVMVAVDDWAYVYRQPYYRHPGRIMWASHAYAPRTHADPLLVLDMVAERYAIEHPEEVRKMKISRKSWMEVNNGTTRKTRI